MRNPIDHSPYQEDLMPEGWLKNNKKMCKYFIPYSNGMCDLVKSDQMCVTKDFKDCLWFKQKEDKMNRPKKIEGKNSKELPFGYWQKCQGYNQAIEDYEKFLPEEIELAKIIYKLMDNYGRVLCHKVAESIHERIGG